MVSITDHKTKPQGRTMIKGPQGRTKAKVPGIGKHRCSAELYTSSTILKQMDSQASRLSDWVVM